MRWRWPASSPTCRASLGTSMTTCGGEEGMRRDKGPVLYLAVRAMTRAAADRAPLFVELDDLDHVPAADAAVVNRHGPNAGIRVDELERERRLRRGDSASPIRAYRLFATQHACRREAALG